MTVRVADRQPARPRQGGIGRSAALIGALTVTSGIVGFGRQLVFAHTVGATCVGTAYTTANQVPNIIYDIVLGGALTSAVVPVLAGPAQAADREDTRRIASALLTWATVLLVPAAAAVGLLAGPITVLLIPGGHGCDHGATLALSARLLIAFAPQVPLYGVAVVLYGILQSHRRFAAPAVAPILSSIVVAAAYIGFAVLAAGRRDRAVGLPTAAELVLALGTTAGVAVLAATAGVPVAGLRLRLRPTLRFPPRVASRVRGLAIAGVATVVAQDLSAVTAIVFANARGDAGALVLYGYGWQVFFMVYAGLAVPLATSAFPVLSASATGNDTGRQTFDRTAAAAARGVTLTSWLGVALLIGAATPLSGVFAGHAAGGTRQLAVAFTFFAPGLPGYGLTAVLSRVLYAAGRVRSATVATAGGWLLVIVADVIIVPLVPRTEAVPALAAGTTVGLTAAGLVLTVMVLRERGRAALHGVARASLVGVTAAAAGAAAGIGVSTGLPVHGFLPDTAVTLLACAAAGLMFLTVAAAGDGGEVRQLAARLRSQVTSRSRA